MYDVKVESLEQLRIDNLLRIESGWFRVGGKCRVVSMK